jgi:hypothetical protein
MENYLVKAIQSLKPNAEFSFTENDYSTIQWHVLDGDAPTESEIEAEIVKIKNDEDLQIKSNADAKAALLDRLGITAEEAALLLG